MLALAEESRSDADLEKLSAGISLVLQHCRVYGVEVGAARLPRWSALTAFSAQETLLEPVQQVFDALASRDPLLLARAVEGIMELLAAAEPFHREAEALHANAHAARGASATLPQVHEEGLELRPPSLNRHAALAHPSMTVLTCGRVAWRSADMERKAKEATEMLFLMGEAVKPPPPRARLPRLQSGELTEDEEVRDTPFFCTNVHTAHRRGVAEAASSRRHSGPRARPGAFRHHHDGLGDDAVCLCGQAHTIIKALDDQMTQDPAAAAVSARVTDYDLLSLKARVEAALATVSMRSALRPPSFADSRSPAPKANGHASTTRSEPQPVAPCLPAHSL
jgi:hypothetical protein